jgi:O-antigen ligase
MKTILIYSLLFTFWAEKALGFKLTPVTGLSLFNLNIYLLLIAWTVFSAVSKRKLIEANNVNKWLILMIFVVIASIPVKMLLGEIPNISILHEVFALKNWVNPFILFFILFNIVDDEKTCKRTLLGLVVLLMITVSSMLLVTFGVTQVGMLKAVHGGRSAGFAEPNQYASYLVLFIPLLLSSFLFQRSFLIKTTSAIFLILAFLGLVTTGSRGGALSLLFSMLAYLTILNRQKMFSLGAIMLVAVTVVVMGVTSYVVAPSKVRQVVSERFDPNSSEDLYKYTSGRTLVLRNGLLVFMKSPIFGHGQNTFVSLMEKRFRIRANSHNDYLLYLVHYGIIGLGIFIMIFTKVFQHVWHHFKATTDPWSKQLYVSYIAGFLGYAFSMLGVNVFAPRYIFWIYTAIIYKYTQLEMTKRV